MQNAESFEMNNSNKKIVLVEDEVLIADSLSRNLTEHGYQVVGHAMDFDEAMQVIPDTKPDLIILDINLEAEKNGIQVAEQIKNRFDLPFIFLTSHIDFATLEAAKETSPAGYLTKPFHFESLYTTIEVALHNYTRKDDSLGEVVLKTGTMNERVNVSDILYLKSDHVYVEVVLKDRTLLVRKSLKALLEELPQNLFFQVHRSYAVNINYVVSFGAGILVLSGIEIPVSRSFQNELVSRLT